MVSFNPEHVLVTQAHMHRLMGSEVATLEIIDYFLSRNVRVTLLTCAVGEPVLSHLRERTQLKTIQVNIDDVDGYLLEYTPDLVWVHHGIIPAVLLNNHEPQTKFVFNHMSAQLPIEYPVSFPIEPMISDLSLFNAAKVKIAHIESGLYSTMQKENLQLFENPAPDSFATLQPKSFSTEKKRLAIISNHIPPELLEALESLRHSFQIELVGIQLEYGATPQRVSPELLNQFDGIITIGKTVQYSLVSGIPVYCYDHFGGPGWITPENLSQARFDNFSGRGFDKKTPAELASELIDLNQLDPQQIIELRNIAHREFLLSSRIEWILSHLGKSPKRTVDLDSEIIAAHTIRMASFADYVQEWVRALGEVQNLKTRLDHSEAELLRAHSVLDKFKKYTGARILKKILK